MANFKNYSTKNLKYLNILLYLEIEILVIKLNRLNYYFVLFQKSILMSDT